MFINVLVANRISCRLNREGRCAGETCAKRKMSPNYTNKQSGRARWRTEGGGVVEGLKINRLRRLRNGSGAKTQEPAGFLHQ